MITNSTGPFGALKLNVLFYMESRNFFNLLFFDYTILIYLTPVYNTRELKRVGCVIDNLLEVWHK